MGDVIDFPLREQKVTTDEYWGGCPYCGKNDGCLNVGRHHWFRCDVHKTRWHIGSNLFSDCRDEGEQTWEQNWAKLEPYACVQPVVMDLMMDLFTVSGEPPL